MADNYDQIYTYILYAFFVGIGIGAVYDVFRIIRMAFTTPWLMSDRYRGRQYRDRAWVNIIVFICDVLFFIITAVISAIFIFYVNNGRIRGIALSCSFVGFAVYYNTVGRLVTLISGFILQSCYRLVRFIITKLIFPLLRLAYLCLCKLKGAFKYISDEAYTRRVLKKRLREVERLFTEKERSLK